MLYPPELRAQNYPASECGAFVEIVAQPLIRNALSRSLVTIAEKQKRISDSQNPKSFFAFSLSSESLNFSGLFVALENDVPADDDDH